MITSSALGPPRNAATSDLRSEADAGTDETGLPPNRIPTTLNRQAVPDQRAIPVKFTKSGYTYRLVERDAVSAIYEQWHATGGLAAYEVVRIRTREERRIGKAVIPAGEFLPTTEEWGRHGWTYSDPRALEQARDRMAALANDRGRERAA